MPITDTFLGLRATDDFTVEGQRPLAWRTGLLKLYPNGKAPLTALLSLIRSEKTTDPQFNWFTRIFAEQGAPTTGIYTDAGLTTEPTAPSVAGDILYVKFDEAYARYFREGHTMLLRSMDNPANDTMGLVVRMAYAGVNSYAQLRLLENSPAGVILDIASIQRALVVGSAHSEGALIPESIQYDPTRWYNFTQIFRNPLEITRTAKETTLRTGDAYTQMQKDTLEMHTVEMEKAFLFGVPSETPGENGKPLRTTGGLIWAIKNGGGVSSVYPSAATQWLTDGLDWFEEQLLLCFNYGSTEKLAFAGNSALLALNRLARKYGTWNYTVTTKAFGINVTEFVFPFGTLMIKTHPLFSQEPTNQKSMVIFEPKQLVYRYITDTTFFKDDQQHGATRYDGIKEEYLTECGLEFHHPICWGYLNNIGGTV